MELDIDVALTDPKLQPILEMFPMIDAREIAALYLRNSKGVEVTVQKIINQQVRTCPVLCSCTRFWGRVRVLLRSVQF